MIGRQQMLRVTDDKNVKGTDGPMVCPSLFTFLLFRSSDKLSWRGIWHKDC